VEPPQRGWRLLWPLWAFWLVVALVIALAIAGALQAWPR
jgi:hypothetical protein